MDGYKIYGYVCVSLCVVGLVLNALNIKIWLKQSRKQRLYSSLPIILTALSATDFMVILSYCLFVIYFFLVKTPNEHHHHSENGMWFALVSINTYILFTTYSNWIAVTLAIFRYIKLSKDKSTSQRFCTKFRAKLAIGIIFTVVFVVVCPNYAFYKVEPLHSAMNHTDYWITKRNIAEAVQRILLWFSGIIMGLVPCSMLIFFTYRVVNAVKRARNESQFNFQADNDRETLMLIGILFMFLVAMLPMGIYSLVLAIQHSHSLQFFFFMENLLASVILYLITIINSTISFFVYLYLSKDFRADLKLIFTRCCCCKKSLSYEAISSTDPQEILGKSLQAPVVHDPLFQ